LLIFGSRKAATPNAAFDFPTGKIALDGDQTFWFRSIAGSDPCPNYGCNDVSQFSAKAQRRSIAFLSSYFPAQK
jgi:hypothetical protein